jgi:MFS family permease
LKFFFFFSGVFIEVLGYDIGPGPVIYVVIAELFPKETREVLISIATMTRFLFNVIVVFIYLPLVELIGRASVFIMLLIFSFIVSIFCCCFVSETKGKEFVSMKEEDNSV